MHQDQLAYNFTEYLGELYRMNLSCSDSEIFSGLPCLFFKAAGETNITDGIDTYMDSHDSCYIS